MDFAAANYSLFREEHTATAGPRKRARPSDLYFWFTGLLTPRNTVNNRRERYRDFFFDVGEASFDRDEHRERKITILADSSRRDIRVSFYKVFPMIAELILTGY